MSDLDKKTQPITSYKFYWGGIADFKVLASNLDLNVSTGRVSKFPTKLICNVSSSLMKPHTTDEQT